MEGTNFQAKKLSDIKIYNTHGKPYYYNCQIDWICGNCVRSCFSDNGEKVCNHNTHRRWVSEEVRCDHCRETLVEKKKNATPTIITGEILRTFAKKCTHRNYSDADLVDSEYLQMARYTQPERFYIEERISEGRGTPADKTELKKLEREMASLELAIQKQKFIGFKKVIKTGKDLRLRNRYPFLLIVKDKKQKVTISFETMNGEIKTKSFIGGRAHILMFKKIVETNGKTLVAAYLNN